MFYFSYVIRNVKNICLRVLRKCPHKDDNQADINRQGKFLQKDDNPTKCMKSLQNDKKKKRIRNPYNRKICLKNDNQQEINI